MAAPIQFLKQIPYFAELSDAELERVRFLVRERTHQRGDVIILEGEPCDAIYFVTTGRVKVFKTSSEGKEQVLRIMKQGDSFNEVPVFDGGPNPASVEAMEVTELYLLRKADLQQLMVEIPTIPRTVTKLLAARLRQMVELVEDLSFRHVTGRVARILLQHAHEQTDAEGGGRLTQQEMATMAGTAREMVGRALKSLEQSGAIKMERGRILILSKEKLERI